jgi:hypothetical protein
MLLGLFTGLICSPLSQAQKISNVDFEVIDNTVRISYDIGECSEEKNYDVKLSLGHDGKLTEITNGLSGDIEKVSCGPLKTIVWDVLSDRSELKGRIYFVVEIQRIHDENQETQIKKEQKWSRRSWKADRGYVGGSLGVFTSYDGYLAAPHALEQNGYFFNSSIGYLPTLFLGVCSTVYIYGAQRNNRFEIASWTNYGIMIGPLISFPIGNRIKWEVRPQIGYSVISKDSDLPDLDSLGTSSQSGLACNIGTGLRLNIGKRTCYLLNLEYLSAPRKPTDYRRPVNLGPGTLGASIGVAFRFY